jgi:hypothetical protein
MKTLFLAAVAALSLGASIANASIPDTRPGWTGRTVVRGSHSTLAGDQTATRATQTGQYGG